MAFRIVRTHANARYAHGFVTMMWLSGQTLASPQNFNLKSVTPASG